MATLSPDVRNRQLQSAVVSARRIAEEGAEKALRQLAIHHHEPFASMTEQQRVLRNRLRAHGRQLGDHGDTQRGTQTLDHLRQACAYEHWHRMLFARFLAENNLLLEPESAVAISLDECRELAQEQNRDWLELAAEYAQKMLLEVFRPDDPVLDVALPPETRQELEAELGKLPVAVFTADDSLGWVYQFWQKEEKERVNKAEVGIGANELAAVTQLFTEDYMVLFLLENTLGAWWTVKRRAEGMDPALPGYEWTFLRLNEDGTATAGCYDGWPRNARELRVLDPCMGSGHFLIFALPILVRMRVEEEGISLEEAIEAVLRDNLFGLELDARCSQIAAFNIALMAWRLAGRHFALPAMNLACSGLGINAGEDDWVKLAGKDGELQDTMRELYFLFSQAPTLGSLIDPARFAQPLLVARFDRVRPVLEKALAAEDRDDNRELAVAAQGLLAAARILASSFTLVVTNVPYLGKGKQGRTLLDYCKRAHPDARADLATCMLERCLRFCVPSGSVAMVNKQEPLFLASYQKLRRRLFKTARWNFLARLGEHAFESDAAAGAFVALVGMDKKVPTPGHAFNAWDCGEDRKPEDKADRLLRGQPISVEQFSQLENPSARVVLETIEVRARMSSIANSQQGIKSGDDGRLRRFFWEIPSLGARWRSLQGTVRSHVEYGGRESIIDWSQEGADCARLQGLGMLNRRGVIVSQMRSLPCTLFSGDLFDSNCAPIVPVDEEKLPALWVYCSSDQFRTHLRQLDQKIAIANGTVTQVPFDLDHWKGVARIAYPQGLPKPHSNDPTQWLFDGHPKESTWPLQVAVARLLGCAWPRQSGSSFLDCPALDPDGLEKHADADGIVCLSSLAGEPPADQRLRSLLADAYGDEWSAQKLSALIGDGSSLKVWLCDRFFEEHCNLFHQRPFIWHIWDGRKDGFHVLVNYHKLAGPSGQGRRTLEKLIYSYLGDWITRQEAEVKSGADGAEARVAAGQHVKAELEKILEGEPPYDLFVRWKPLHEQPIGWEPDLNDGVRLNIRPWLQAKPYKPARKDACILRTTPRITYGKDRGKESVRDEEEFPWLRGWDEKTQNFAGGEKFDGNRWNDLHYTRAFKQAARERKAGKKGGERS